AAVSNILHRGVARNIVPNFFRTPRVAELAPIRASERIIAHQCCQRIHKGNDTDRSLEQVVKLIDRHPDYQPASTTSQDSRRIRCGVPRVMQALNSRSKVRERPAFL